MWPLCINLYSILLCGFSVDHFALHPQKRGGLLGTGGMGRKSEGLTADATRKRPERLWTTARTMEVLRRCPLTTAQQLVHCTIAVSTAVLGRSHKDNVRCTAVGEQLEAKEVHLLQLSSHLPTPDLFWANLKVPLHLPPLDLLISPGTLGLFCVNLYSLSYHVASL